MVWTWGIASAMGLKQTIPKNGGLPHPWELSIPREQECSGKSFSEPPPGLSTGVPWRGGTALELAAAGPPRCTLGTPGHLIPASHAPGLSRSSLRARPRLNPWPRPGHLSLPCALIPPLGWQPRDSRLACVTCVWRVLAARGSLHSMHRGRKPRTCWVPTWRARVRLPGGKAGLRPKAPARSGGASSDGHGHRCRWAAVRGDLRRRCVLSWRGG